MPGADAAPTDDDRVDRPAPADADRVAALVAATPDLVLPLAHDRARARVLAADLIGDPAAPPVLLVHGTPDSRHARHPDPDATTGAGVRLIAVDRPGFGHSTFDPDGTPVTFAADLVALLDHLALDRVDVVAWSAGSVWALGLAASAPDRVRTVTMAGALVPAEPLDATHGDPALRVAAGETRLGMVDTAADAGPDLAAELIGPMLLPDPATPAAALEHIRGGHADSSRELAAIAGAEEQMAAALMGAAQQGTAGVIHDLATQFGPTPFPLDAVRAPVHLVTGADDHTCPPAFAQWYAAQLPTTTVEIVPGAGHAHLLTAWTEILRHAVEGR